MTKSLSAADRVMARLRDGAVPVAGLTVAEMNELCRLTKRGVATFFRSGIYGYYRLRTADERMASLRIRTLTPTLQVVR